MILKIIEDLSLFQWRLTPLLMVYWLFSTSHFCLMKYIYRYNIPVRWRSCKYSCGRAYSTFPLSQLNNGNIHFFFDGRTLFSFSASYLTCCDVWTKEYKLDSRGCIYYTHSHSHARTRTHTDAHMRGLSRSLSHTQTHIHINTLTHPQTQFSCTQMLFFFPSDDPSRVDTFF